MLSPQGSFCSKEDFLPSSFPPQVTYVLTIEHPFPSFHLIPNLLRGVEYFESTKAALELAVASLTARNRAEAAVWRWRGHGEEGRYSLPAR